MVQGSDDVLGLEVYVYDVGRCFAGLDHPDVIANHTSTVFHSRAILHTHTNRLPQAGDDKPVVLGQPGEHYYQSEE